MAEEKLNVASVECAVPVEQGIDLGLLGEIAANVGADPTNLITILQQAQDVYGYLPRSVIYRAAELTRVSPAEVMGVATFYSQFRLEPVGKYVIMLCQGTACHVSSSARVLTALCEHLGIKSGQTTPDGLFTIEEVACLGCCSLAPVIMINGEAYGNLTPDSAIDVIKGIQREEAAACAQ